MDNFKASPLKVKIIFSVALLCLLALSVFSYVRLRSLFESAKVVQNTNRYVVQLERARSTVKNAEAHQNGFLIARDAKFLEEYRYELVGLQNRLKVIDSIGDSDSSIHSLTNFVESRLATAGEMLLVPEPAKLYNRVNAGALSMDPAMQILNELLSRNETLLQSEFGIFNMETEFTPFMTISLILFTLLVIVMAYLRVNKSLERSDILREELSRQKTMFESRTLLYEHMLSASEDLVTVVNPDLNVIAANQRAAAFLGGSKGDIFGKNILELRPDLANERIFSEIDRAFTGEKILINEYQTAFTDDFWEIQFTPLATEGRIFGVMITVRDVTEFTITSNKLKASEERYHLMIEEVSDYAIIFINADGNIENWNKGAQNIKGYEAEEIIGKNFSIFYPDEDQKSQLPQKLIALAREKGKALHEGWRRRKDGSLFYGSVVITAIKNADGELVGFTKVTRDLTERKHRDDNIARHAELLEQKNRDLASMNKELQSFAYVSSHDMQEPLRKIQTFSDRIMDSEFENLSDRGKDYFTRMKNAASRMQRLIEDLLEYASTNVKERKFENVNLEEIVNDVKHELKESIDASKAIINTRGLCNYNVIPFQFRQLAHNLISNSLKFAKKDEPSVINVTCEKKPGDEFDQPGLNPEKNYAHIKFSDNGIGFDMQYKNKIFEIFQRLHGKHEFRGTGIGLSICKKIVENHGGIISASSEPGVGATFDIFLPEVAIEGVKAD